MTTSSKNFQAEIQRIEKLFEPDPAWAILNDKEREARRSVHQNTALEKAKLAYKQTLSQVAESRKEVNGLVRKKEMPLLNSQFSAEREAGLNQERRGLELARFATNEAFEETVKDAIQDGRLDEVGSALNWKYLITDRKNAALQPMLKNLLARYQAAADVAPELESLQRLHLAEQELRGRIRVIERMSMDYSQATSSGDNRLRENARNVMREMEKEA